METFPEFYNLKTLLLWKSHELRSVEITKLYSLTTFTGRQWTNFCSKEWSLEMNFARFIQLSICKMFPFKIIGRMIYLQCSNYCSIFHFKHLRSKTPGLDVFKTYCLPFLYLQNWRRFVQISYLFNKYQKSMSLLNSHVYWDSVYIIQSNHK